MVGLPELEVVLHEMPDDPRQIPPLRQQNRGMVQAGSPSVRSGYSRDLTQLDDNW